MGKAGRWILVFLIAAGAGIRAGVPLPLVRQIDIAPTLASLLGLEMPSADGVPLVGLLAGDRLK